MNKIRQVFLTLDRRRFLQNILAAATSLVGTWMAGGAAESTPETVTIGSRRALLVNGFLIDQLVGNAELRLYHPVPGEISLVHNDQQ
ncbi:MAG: hypothetical protein KDA86_22270 [Planctomycetaceae bacterium]|nr:hypothetical protein [Planctomycetaceae bacterium]